MNRVYLYSHELEKSTDDIYYIEDNLRINHIQKILKKSIHQEIKIVVINEGIGIAVLLESSKEKIKLKILTLSTHLERNPKVHLLIALCRPPTIKKIIEHGTTLGVKSFSFYPATHSEKSYLNSHLFKDQNLKKLLALGISQSGIFYQSPTVNLYNRLEDVPLRVSEKTPENDLSKANKFFFSLDSSDNFLQLQNFKEDNILLAIGPERGWTAAEEINFNSLNFKSLNLGRSILRTEIATFTALAAFQN